MTLNWDIHYFSAPPANVHVYGSISKAKDKPITEDGTQIKVQKKKRRVERHDRATQIRSRIHRSGWIGGENPGSGSDTTPWLLIWRFSFSVPKPRARNCTCEKPSGRTGRGVEESVSVGRRGCSAPCLCSVCASAQSQFGVVTVCTWGKLATEAPGAHSGLVHNQNITTGKANVGQSSAYICYCLKC